MKIAIAGAAGPSGQTLVPWPEAALRPTPPNETMDETFRDLRHASVVALES